MSSFTSTTLPKCSFFSGTPCTTDDVRDINEVAETAKLLHIDIQELCTVDNFTDTFDKVVESETTSKFDIVDSLLEIFDKQNSKTKENSQLENICCERECCS